MGAAVERIDLHLDLGDVFGLSEGGIRIAAGLNEMGGKIVRHLRVHKRGAILQGLLDVHLDEEWLIRHIDKSGAILGGIAVNRNNHGDGLADIVHIAARQRSLRLRISHRGMRDQQRHFRVKRTDIVAGIDRHHAGMVLRRRYVNGRDARPCMRAAQEGNMQRVGERNIVDEGPSPRSSLGSILRSMRAPKLRVDMLVSFQVRPRSSAARRTAAMMLI